MISFRKSALSICFATLIGSISATAAAEQLKAADVHPEGYPVITSYSIHYTKLSEA